MQDLQSYLDAKLKKIKEISKSPTLADKEEIKKSLQRSGIIDQKGHVITRV